MTLPANTEQPGQPGQPETEPAPKKIDVVNPEPKVNSVLLVAPHAWNKTEGKENGKDYTDRDYDVRTGEIAKKVAEKIGCKALINWDWKKGDPTSQRKEDERNYNDAKQAGEDKKFISHLKAVGGQETLVLWIHGIDDDNLKGEAENKDTGFNGKPEELCALIGYGQHDENPRLTADPKTVVSLTKFLAEHGMKSISARKTGSGAKNNNQYRAWDKNNMCQWFNQQTDEKGTPKYPNVQSLQLEIKFNDFRDNGKTADKTADILTAVLQKHLADEKRANEAYQEITNIFGHHLENAMEGVGRYLIKTFYDNKIELAEKRETEHPYSFHQLVRIIQKRNDNKPSKTWLYNAVDLAIDSKKLEGIPTYKELGHSHRVYLTHVKDEKEKVKLITKAHDQGYTVAQLRQEIAKTKEPKQNITIHNLPPNKVLENLPLRRLNKLLVKTDAEIKELNKKIKEYEHNQKRLNEVVAEKSKQK